jgi:3-hydroxyacyl-[acyl-carrier-protein] dehydratase
VPGAGREVRRSGYRRAYRAAGLPAAGALGYPSTFVPQRIIRRPDGPRDRRRPTRPEERALNAIAPADVNEILKHIAHRFPFLLVDRVAGGVAGESVQVVKLVSCNEPFFQGMAPDRMEMPQVLVLEALAQAAGVLTHYSGLMKPHGGSLIFFAAVENARFGRAVVPGDELRLDARLVRSRSGFAKIHGIASVDGNMVCDAEMTAFIRDTTSDEQLQPSPTAS